jgi:hypothetical protein
MPEIHRIRRLWPALVAVVVAAVVAALALSNRPAPSKQGQVEITDRQGQRWRLALATSTRDAPAGTEIGIRLDITNVEPTSQNLTFVGSVLEVVATDSSGREAWKHTRPPPPIGRYQQNVGGKATTPLHASWITSGIPPGTYTLEATARFQEFQFPVRVVTKLILR